jgi:hypothetical protein
LITDDTLLCKTSNTTDHIGKWIKNKNRGLKAKELANQFYKERDADSSGFQRVKQLSSDKISMAIQMVKDAIKTVLNQLMYRLTPGLCVIALCLKYSKLKSDMQKSCIS